MSIRFRSRIHFAAPKHRSGTHPTLPELAPVRSLPRVGALTAELSDCEALVGRAMTLGPGDGTGIDLQVKAGVKWRCMREGVMPELQFKVDNIRPRAALAGIASAAIAAGQRIQIDREVPVLKRGDGEVSAEVEVVGSLKRQGLKLTGDLREANVVLWL